MMSRSRFGATVLFPLLLAVPEIHAQPKIKAKDVPTEKDRCLLQCDAKQRQCVIDGTGAEICQAGHDTCMVGCNVPPPTPTEAD